MHLRVRVRARGDEHWHTGTGTGARAYGYTGPREARTQYLVVEALIVLLSETTPGECMREAYVRHTWGMAHAIGARHGRACHRRMPYRRMPYRRMPYRRMHSAHAIRCT